MKRLLQPWLAIVFVLFALAQSGNAAILHVADANVNRVSWTMRHDTCSHLPHETWAILQADELSATTVEGDLYRVRERLFDVVDGVPFMWSDYHFLLGGAQWAWNSRALR